jgi:hypothetical protein
MVCCAQCGNPISAPDWTESGSHCVHFLWHCDGCDYKFEAVAFYAGPQAIPDSIAA